MAISDTSLNQIAPAEERRERRYRPRIRVASEEAPQYEEPLHHAPERKSAERGAVRVLGVVAAILLAIVLASLLRSPSAFASSFSAFSVRFLSIFIEAAPFLLLGTVVSGLIEVFVRREHIARLVPSNAVGGVLMGTMLGFAFPVCECGVVPVVRQLYAKSLPISVGIAFLLAAPVMNPIVLLSTIAAFGLGEVVLWRFAITAVVAITVGLVFSVIVRRQGVLLPQVLTGSRLSQSSSDHSAPSPGIRLGAKRALGIAGDEFFEMGRYLIIGCLLAAAMQTLVSQDVLLSLGQGPIISVLTMQLLAFVLSVCSTVDAFIALAFTQTFATGSLLAFLTFGPMVDVKSTLMFLGVFKRRIVALLILLPFLMTGVTAIIINLLGSP